MQIDQKEHAKIIDLIDEISELFDDEIAACVNCLDDNFRDIMANLDPVEILELLIEYKRKAAK